MASHSRLALRRLRKYVRPYYWALGVAVLFVIIVGVLEAAAPLLIGIVFDTMLGDSGGFPLDIPFIDGVELSVPAEYGVWVLVALVVSTVVKAGAGYASVAATAHLGQSVVRDLRTDLYRSIMFQPLDFFAHHPTGELISRVSTDVEKVQTAASETLAEFLKQTAVLVSLVFVILVLDWRLSLMSLVVVPLFFYPTVLFGRRSRRLSRSNQEEMAGMANILLETFSGNRIVKIFTMESAELVKFQAAAQRIFRLGLKLRLTQALASPLMEVLGMIVIVALLLYARNEILSGRMTVGLFVAFIVALMRLYDPVRRMSGINNSFQQAIGASWKLFEIMESLPEPDPGDRRLDEFREAIEFRDVSFAYSQDDPTLEGVSFAVFRGEVVALVGSSGVGKTTLVNLLPRFHDVTSGSITIDGIDVRDFQLTSLRSQIATGAHGK